MGRHAVRAPKHPGQRPPRQGLPTASSVQSRLGSGSSSPGQASRPVRPKLTCHHLRRDPGPETHSSALPSSRLTDIYCFKPLSFGVPFYTAKDKLSANPFATRTTAASHCSRWPSFVTKESPTLGHRQREGTAPFQRHAELWNRLTRGI